MVSDRYYNFGKICIREGIALFLQRTDASPDEVMEVAGKFRPLSADTLKPHDLWWADAAVAEQTDRSAP